jgi:hypothetical protein
MEHISKNGVRYVTSLELLHDTPTTGKLRSVTIVRPEPDDAPTEAKHGKSCSVSFNEASLAQNSRQNASRRYALSTARRVLLESNLCPYAKQLLEGALVRNQ